MEALLPPDLRVLVEDHFGRRLVRWQRPDCGLSATIRLSTELENGQHVFIKAATDDETAAWLRTEYLALTTLAGDFMPGVIGWLDNVGMYPVLITQDLSHAYWPASHQGVQWREGDFQRVIEATKGLGAMAAPDVLPVLSRPATSIWEEIANHASSFLALGLCTERWFRGTVVTLADAEMRLVSSGNSLVHGDVRSDNICLFGNRVMFVDWSHAARGSGRYDLANLLPTLHLEGGPIPFSVMPDGGDEAAAACAAHAYRLFNDRTMPDWLKRVFVQLIRIEFEWAVACLELGRPEG